VRTSGFFKLQKIRTLEKDIPRKNFTSFENKKTAKSRKLVRLWRISTH